MYVWWTGDGKILKVEPPTRIRDKARLSESSMVSTIQTRRPTLASSIQLLACRLHHSKRLPDGDLCQQAFYGISENTVKTQNLDRRLGLQTMTMSAALRAF